MTGLRRQDGGGRASRCARAAECDVRAQVGCHQQIPHQETRSNMTGFRRQDGCCLRHAERARAQVTIEFFVQG